MPNFSLLDPFELPETDVLPYSQQFIQQLPAEWRWIGEVRFAGNEVWQYGALLLTVLLALLVGRIVRWFVRSAAQRSQRRGHQLFPVGLTAIAKSIGFLSLVIGLSIGISFLSLSPTVENGARTAITVLWHIAIGYAIYQLVAVVDEWLIRISARTASKLDDMLVPLVRKSLKGTVILLILVQISSDVSGAQLTSVIAGLGVGGLAVGLAAQDTVKNFFGSMMIFGDRPFELGDEISLGNIGGVVEAVGFRSTRFRTGEGHLVTIPNGDLANKTIVNISRQPSQMRKFTLALRHDLPPEKIERALQIVRDTLADHEGMKPQKPPRVFLQEITTQAVILSVQYWYHFADGLRMSAFNERITLDILRRLAKEEIGLQKT
jgi:MscS family membrane protein